MIARQTPGWPPATLRRVPRIVGTIARVRRKAGGILVRLRQRLPAARARVNARVLAAVSGEYCTSAAAFVNRVGHPAMIEPRPSGSSLAAAELAVGHVFDVLGSGPQKLVSADCGKNRWRSEFASLTEGLPADLLSTYQPIEWHSDFTSGYRWDPMTPHAQIRYAPEPGVEIKIPRELSRFHHIGALGHAGSERHAVEFLLQTADWIAANPLGRGVNWASAMDVGIRAVNWVWGVRMLAHRLDRFPRSVAVIGRSLRQHGQHITENLDFYQESATNHYLANIAGLVYIASACPDFPESDRWLHFGLHQLVSEMSRQVYPDGMDFEASTHYHRLMAEMFLSTAVLVERLPPERRGRIAALPLRGRRGELRLQPLSEVGLKPHLDGHVLPGWFYERLLNMVEITAALTKPNGRVPQFGDNDSGRLHKLGADPEDARDHRHLCAVGGVFFDRDDFKALGVSAAAEGALIAGGVAPVRLSRTTTPLSEDVRVFPHAGIVVVRDENSYLAITCGPNGHNGRGGHGHNDKGSFDLTVDGDDFVADGGCSVYTADVSRRNSFRSTYAHSTAWVVGSEQDPLPPGLAGLFRHPERARRRLDVNDDRSIVCEHNGFGATHRRRFVKSRCRLEIVDELDTPAQWQVGFNLDPAVTPQLSQSGAVWVARLRHESGCAILLRVSGVSSLRATRALFSYGYGQPVENWRVIADAAGPRVVSRFEWNAADDASE